MNPARPVTYLITKGELTPENFEQQKSGILDTVRAALSAGISMIQIREKLITATQLFELAREAASIADDSPTKVLVNGRPDIAAAAGGHGVHLPENGLPVAAVRRSFTRPFLIGASVHSLEAARSAKDDGADFVLLGPVFDSGQKKGKGIDELQTVCNAMGDFPIIAVGGIDKNNRDEVLRAGAAGYAAITYLNNKLKSLP
jgi:thiamine-phosphate diphosphorylase